MCVICAINKGAKFSEEEFERCWDSNPDGGGYVYLDENSMFKVFKSMDKKELKKQFEFDFKRHSKWTPFMLHFRIKSHGALDITNVHPFQINEDVYMCHNGMLPITIDPKDGRSDTRTFAEDVLASMPRNFLRNKGSTFLIYKYINSNKLCFLDKQGSFAIFNKSLGEEHEGRWFSNSSYKTERAKKVFTPVSEYESTHYPGYGYFPNMHGTNGSQHSATILHRCQYCEGFYSGKEWINASDMCVFCDDMWKSFSHRTELSEFEGRTLAKKVLAGHRAISKKAREEKRPIVESIQSERKPVVRLLPARTEHVVTPNQSIAQVSQESAEFNQLLEETLGFAYSG